MGPGVQEFGIANQVTLGVNGVGSLGARRKLIGRVAALLDLVACRLARRVYRAYTSRKHSTPFTPPPNFLTNVSLRELNTIAP
jgi:hypothetical protein